MPTVRLLAGARGTIIRAFGLVAGANSLVTEPFGGCDTNSFGFFLENFTCHIKPLKYFAAKQIRC